MSDFRAALASLLAAPRFAATAIGTLSAALALVAIIASVAHAYVFRGLPFPAADRLYRVDYAPPGQPWPRGMETIDWTTLADVAELTVAWDLDVFYVLGHDSPESAPGAWISPGYVAAYGLRAASGRVFGPEDFRPDAPPVAMISDRLWQTRFAADPSIVGKTFHAYVSDRPEEAEVFTVIGVLPRELWHVSPYTEVLAPLRAPAYPYQLRLREGVSAARAAARVDAIVRGGVPTVPPQLLVSLTSLQESYTAQVRPMLWAIAAGAVLVLSIAAANVGVLTIVRARQRESEVAVRLALGASHARVARLMAMEGVLIGGSAAGVALVVAAGVLPATAPAIERALQRRVPGGLETLTLDVTGIAVVLLLAAVIVICLCSVPIAAIWHSRGVTLAGAGRGSTDSRGAARARAVLIAAEVAASLTLLVGAALMADSALRMLRVDFGLEADDVTTAGLALRDRSFPDLASRAALFDRLERELQHATGTGVVAFADRWPMQEPPTVEVSGAGARAATSVLSVSPQYFAALGMRMHEGRGFGPDDRAEGERVAVVSAALASRLWPGASAVGQRVTVLPEGAEPQDMIVVGVVNDVKQTHADTASLDLYVPLAQRAGRFAFVYLRAPDVAWHPDARAAIARVTRDVALAAERPLADAIEQERARPRVLALLLAAFAVLACGLAIIGMHGVIAYAVRQRRREIALRIAIGASTRAVTTMVMRQGLVVLAWGLAIGLAGAVALGRVLQSQLFGVSGADVRVLTAAVAALGAAAVLAVWWPAARAATLDPAPLLRSE